MQKNIVLSILALACVSPQAFAISHQNKSSYKPAHIHLVANEFGTLSEQDAKNLIARFTEESIGFLENTKLSKEKKTQEFKRVLYRDFDLDTIARFSLGKNWRQATKSEKAEYKKLFKDMIISVYSSRFSEYNGQKIVVSDARAQGQRDVFVTTMIKQPAGPDIQVDWRVRNNKQGNPQVIDVIVEGVSMALTQRSEFSSIIQRGGGKVGILISHLEQSK